MITMRTSQPKPLLRALAGETLATAPWWMMRQAGRYLPEYREIRAKAKDFIALCVSPTLAAEVTMQPVRRYGMDAAILISGILMLPYALGRSVSFREGEGPALDPIGNHKALARLDGGRVISRLEPVLETVRRVSAAVGVQAA